MHPELQPGDKCRVKKNLAFDGKQVFRPGDIGIIKSLKETASGTQYVVISPLTNDPFTLKAEMVETVLDQEVSQIRESHVPPSRETVIVQRPLPPAVPPAEPAAPTSFQASTSGVQPPSDYARPTHGSYRQPSARRPPVAPTYARSAAGRTRTWMIIGAIVVAAITIGVVLYVAFANQAYKKYKAEAEKVLYYLEELDGGLDVGYVKLEYNEALRHVTTAYSKFDAQCSAEDRGRGSHESITAAIGYYMLAEETWQEGIESYYLSVDESTLQSYWKEADSEVEKTRRMLDQGE